MIAWIDPNICSINLLYFSNVDKGENSLKWLCATRFYCIFGNYCEALQKENITAHHRLSSIKGNLRLPSKVFFHQKSSSIKGCLSSKVVFHQRSLSVKGPFPSKVIFRQRSFSVKGRLLSEVNFHYRSRS